MQIANKPETSIENYLEVIGKKTAELFGASCKSGVIVSEGNAEQQNAAYDYGFNLGLAFQIVDDLMDFNNLPNKMGKNLGDDFKLGKTTLPVILAWQKSNPKEKQFWVRTLKELNQENGITIILVTHEKEVAAYGSRLIQMKDGVVQTDETMVVYKP